MSTNNAMQYRITDSADISDFVYDYEKEFARYIKSGKTIQEAKSLARKFILEKLNNQSNLTFTDATYDPATGIAAIAVYDSQTGETYIAYFHLFEQLINSFIFQKIMIIYG